MVVTILPHMFTGEPSVSISILQDSLMVTGAICSHNLVPKQDKILTFHHPGSIIFIACFLMINNQLQYHPLNPIRSTVKWLCTIIKLMILNFNFSCMAAFIWCLLYSHWVNIGFWCEVIFILQPQKKKPLIQFKKITTNRNISTWAHLEVHTCYSLI